MLYPENFSKNLTASGLVKTGRGRVRGVVVNSHSSGTLKLWANTAGSGTVLFNTITFAAGPQSLNLFDCPFDTGLYATIGGTADITIVYQ